MRLVGFGKTGLLPIFQFVLAVGEAVAAIAAPVHAKGIVPDAGVPPNLVVHTAHAPEPLEARPALVVRSAHVDRVGREPLVPDEPAAPGLHRPALRFQRLTL